MEQLLEHARRLRDYHATGVPGSVPAIAEITAELIKDVEADAPRDEILRDVADLLEAVKGGSAEGIIRPLYAQMLGDGE